MSSIPFPPPMADIHSHILPGVDDGAGTIEDALKLLWMAVKDGVVIQILTPHINLQRYKNSRESLEAHFLEFRDIVEQAHIPIELHLNAEVRICHEIMQMVDADSIPWLGSWSGQKTFLLEFPQTSVPVGSENLIQWLRRKGILPVIAHPERNLVFQKFPDKLQPLLDAGCPLQVTAGSVTGQFGRKAQKLAQNLLKQDKVRFLASDCHNLRYRPPNLSHGIKAAAKIIGQTRASELVSDNVFDLLIGDRHRKAV